MRTLLVVLALVGCGDDEQTADGGETGEELEASAIAGCGPADGVVLLILEGSTCTWSVDAEGLNIMLELGSGDVVPASYDVLDSPAGYCRLCDASSCEDATSCTVEVTAVTQTQLDAEIDAVFPSGSVTRSVEAQLCPLEGSCG